MNTLIDNMDAVLFEAHKTKGWLWVDQEPLWITWSLSKFGTRSLIYTLAITLNTFDSLLRSGDPHAISSVSSVSH